MANQHKNKTTDADQIFSSHVAVGPSNEELMERQRIIDEKKARGEYVSVSVGDDAHDKAIDGFGDIEFDPLGLTDPLAALKKAYQRPGMALKLLSRDCNTRLGTRGYQIVKDESGDPVMSGKMVLGEIPEKWAEARRKAPIKRSNEELRAITDAQQEAVEKMRQDAKGLGLTVLESGDRINDHGRSYETGLTVERGESI